MRRISLLESMIIIAVVGTTCWCGKIAWSQYQEYRAPFRVVTAAGLVRATEAEWLLAYRLSRTPGNAPVPPQHGSAVGRLTAIGRLATSSAGAITYRRQSP
jgi:hypothetical protein